MKDINTTPVSLHERCQYTNKQCPNRRMTKRNGQLHRLCEEHRDKANNNHRRWLKNRIEQATAIARAATASGPVSLAVVGEVSISGNTKAADGKPACDAVEDNILLDKEELDEFLDELAVSPEELAALRAEAAKAFHTQEK